MSEPVGRPVPQANVYVLSQAFWDGAREGRLMLQFCLDTNRFQHPPHPLSLYSGSQNITWRAASGNGHIYALTTVRVPGSGVSGRLPLIVGTIELDEHVRIIANIVDSPAESVRVGQRVTVAWDHLDGGTPYPAFKTDDLAGAAHAST